jgi:hypothetical protein
MLCPLQRNRPTRPFSRAPKPSALFSAFDVAQAFRPEAFDFNVAQVFRPEAFDVTLGIRHGTPKIEEELWIYNSKARKHW